MFTIQYEAVSGDHKMQTFDGSRTRLIQHLTHFERPIMAAYQNTTVITKSIRSEMSSIPPHSMTRAARLFVSSPA